MKPSRFLVATLALVGLLGAAEVRSASVEHQRGLEAFRKKALQQRKAQGLDKNEAALYAKYPSPEVKMVGAGGGAATPEVPAGTEATLTATGRFLGDSFAHLDCTGVEVLSQKITGNTLELRVRVAPTTLPGLCELRLFSPVSLAYQELPGFHITGTHQWELATANGLKVLMRTSSQKDSIQLTGSSAWSSRDGKALGTRQINVERTEEGAIVNVQRSPEEMKTAGKAWDSAARSSDKAAAQKEVKALQQKMKSECMTLPPDKMTPCIQKYSEQMQAASEKMRSVATATQQTADAGVVGCQTMRLKVTAGKVSGQGTRCGAPGDVNVTGTVTVSK